jgi:8-oxo-dGTP pyrophosphatase MutT (NUDIX family)
MLGGAIDANENPQQAARRELLEEASIDVEPDKLVPLIHAEAFFEKGGEKLSFSAFVFYCQSAQKITPSSDIEDVTTMSEHELLQFVQRMTSLPETPIAADDPATWADYGKVWGPIHGAALERVKELGL